LIDGKLAVLSSFTQQRNLLDRLQRAGLVVSCNIALHMEGATLVNRLQEQIIEHCNRNRFQFPPPPVDSQVEFQGNFMSIHDLPFTLLEVTINNRGGQPRFRKTRVNEPLTLQVLLSALFAKKIVNTLHAQEKVPLLFISKSHSSVVKPSELILL
jgi:hypothetical protein